MTFTLNGIGTRISAGRKLTAKEKQMWQQYLPATSEFQNVQLFIGTESFVFIFLPLIPLKTYVYCWVKSKWYESGKYLRLFYPAGENKVYWPHVKSSWQFYVGPLLAVFILYIIFSGQ